MISNLAANNNEPYKTEIIDGKKIIMMSPALSNHNLVRNRVFGIFESYLRNNICLPFIDGDKLVLEENGYVLPDVFIVCDRSKFKRDGVYGAPNLVIEVLSASTRRYDRGDKKDLYERSGIGEYWLIEPELKSIEVFIHDDSGRYKLDNVYGIPDEYESEEDKIKIPQEIKTGLFPDLVIKLEEIFENVQKW